jgi:hypothetical protein
VSRTAGAPAVDQRDLVGELIADQRQRVVVEDRYENLGRAHPSGHRRSVRVDRLENHEIVAQMHQGAVAAADRDRARLRGEPPVDHRRRAKVGWTDQIAGQVPENAGVAGGPPVPVVDERSALSVRADRRDRLIVTEQITRLALAARQVCPHARQAQAGVGDDLVEAVHDVRLGHDRETADGALVERGRVDAAEAPAMPRRVLLSNRHHLA